MTKSAVLHFLRDKWKMILPCSAFLLAFTLRYHFLATYHYPLMIHEQDAVGYMDVAKNIARFQPLNMAGRPPGYPLVIALMALLPIGLELAARIASVFMDALIVVPLYIFGRIYLDRAASAYAVCLLWATFSFSLYFAPSPLSQSSFLCYLICAIVSLYKGLEHSNKAWLFGAGALIALSFLTRPEAIVGFAFGFLLCLSPLFRRDGFRIKTVIPALVFLTGFLVLAGPYLIAFHEQLGYWGVTAKTEAALKTQDVTLTLNSKGELEKIKAGLSMWKEHYGTLPAFIDAVRSNIQAYFMVYYKTFPTWMHIVSVFGMASLLWRTKFRNFQYMLILLAVTTPNYIVNVSKTHSYIYSVFPVTFICFIAFFENVLGVIRWSIDKFRFAMKPIIYEVGLTTLLIVVVSFVSVGFFREADANYQSPDLVTEAMITEKIYKGAAEFIKNNSEKNDVIMTRWGLVGYFADRPVVTLPKGGVSEVVEYGRKNGARILLVDTGSVLMRRQELMELLDPLEGKAVNPHYGIEVIGLRLYPDLGGYVIYRYQLQRN